MSERQDQEDEAPCSGLREIKEPPVFEGSIPDEVLNSLKPKELRYLFDTMSKNEKNLQWLVDLAIQHNESHLKMCRWQAQINRKIQFWTARYGWLVWIGSVVGSGLLLEIVRVVSSKFLP